MYVKLLDWVDINKIDWNQNDIKHLMKTDHDTLEYRLNESKNTNYNDLDLEMLKLNDLFRYFLISYEPLQLIPYPIAFVFGHQTFLRRNF